MGREDWYRRESWTQSDQDAFWQRLRRSRQPFYRAQYLRIQAHYLEQAGLAAPAVGLLESALLEEPEGSEVANIHHQLGTCHEKQGRLPDALAHLRLALTTQAQRPNWQTAVSLTFGRIVVENRLRDLYCEVLGALTSYEARGSGAFQLASVRYLHAAILALIHHDSGQEDQARDFARRALLAADETRSVFRKHPHFGLVTDKATRLYDMVAGIANAG